MKRWSPIGLLLLWVGLFSCSKPAVVPVSQALADIDTLMQCQPDSALNRLLSYYDTVEDRHYANLLLSELLYKNDYEQTNRDELLDAMFWYDSVAEAHPNDKGMAFLDARCHYMDGVGYYEMDSVVAACAEYLKALEIMETHFEEKDLVGYKAKFMALTYSRLCILFTDQYLHMQAVSSAKQAYQFYQKQDSLSWQSAWALNKIGLNYDMMDQWDSAEYYYQKAGLMCSDSNSLIYKDICAHHALINYKMGQETEKPLSKLKHLIRLSQSDKEYISRCAAVGEVYYHEKEYDSAIVYLEKLFEANTDLSAKKQAAEWLVEIHNEKGEYEEASYYANYLVPFANLNENKGFIKSQLIDVYQDNVQKRESFLHQQLVNKNHRRAAIIMEVFVVCLVISAMLFLMRTKQLKNERREHKIKRAALAGRLRHSNAELKRERDTKTQTIMHSGKNNVTCFKFEDEPICRHIISVCNDPKNPIKSNVPVTYYADLALTDAQEAQLKDAIDRHFNLLFEKLRSLYPELKNKDLLYCYLCLLGLDNSQIAVMTQLSYRTIWEREKRLQKVFNTEDKVSVALHGFLIS